LHSRVYINATSTPQQKNRSGAHKPALAGSGGQLTVARDAGSRQQPTLGRALGLIA
jgi:hypothetical protein